VRSVKSGEESEEETKEQTKPKEEYYFRELESGSEPEQYRYVLSDVSMALIKYQKKYYLNRKAMAEALGVSQEYIKRIELGRADLTLKELVNLVQKIGGSLEVKIHL
jgi:DNA-binding XRE family transcriptional regulator